MDIKGVHDIYQLRSTQNKNLTARRQQAEDAQDAAATSGDVIEISPEAALRAKLGATVKPNAAEESMDARRLQSLRQKYLGDACPVPGRDVAAALLNRIMPEDKDGAE